MNKHIKLIAFLMLTITGLNGLLGSAAVITMCIHQEEDAHVHFSNSLDSDIVCCHSEEQQPANQHQHSEEPCVDIEIKGNFAEIILSSSIHCPQFVQTAEIDIIDLVMSNQETHVQHDKFTHTSNTLEATSTTIVKSTVFRL